MSEQPPQGAPPAPPTPSTAPPPPPPAPAAEGPSGPRASFRQRFGAFVVDAIILSIAQGIVNSIFGVDFFGYQYGFFADAGRESNAGASLLNTIIQIGYYTYFEGAPAGQTPGKRILGIRVIDFRSGGALGYPRAALRWLCRILSALPCALGFFWMLWDREKQTWHDKLTNTVVVPASAYPAEKWPG